MNKKGIIFFGFIFSFFMSIYAQDEQLKPDAIDTTFKKYKKIMIVPFEPQMYLCPVNKNLVEGSNKTTKQIVKSFRYGIALQVQSEFLYEYSTVSLIHVRDTTGDLFNTYAGIGYKFEEVPEEPEPEEKNKTKKLFKGFGGLNKKEKTDKPSKTTVKNGQIISSKSLAKKYAKVYVKIDKLLPYLGNKYGADLFVFITEMDLENDMSDQFALQNGTYERILRFHFTMLDGKGKVVNSGIVETRIPNNVNDIGVIQNNYFPAIAKQLTQKLPKPENPNVDKKGAINIHEKTKR